MITCESTAVVISTLRNVQVFNTNEKCADLMSLLLSLIANPYSDLEDQRLILREGEKGKKIDTLVIIKLKTTHKFVESQAAKAVVGQTVEKPADA